MKVFINVQLLHDKNTLFWFRTIQYSLAIRCRFSYVDYLTLYVRSKFAHSFFVVVVAAEINEPKSATEIVTWIEEKTNDHICERIGG